MHQNDKKWWFYKTSHRKEDWRDIQVDMYRSEALEGRRLSNLGIEYKGW